MCQQSKLVYSAKYKINVDLEDFWCTSAENHDFGKKIARYAGNGTRYIANPRKLLYLHRIVADATVYNPRPDIFNMLDHIDENKQNIHWSNLRWVNCSLNHLNSGVCASRRRKKWMASTNKNGKKKSMVRFLRSGYWIVFSHFTMWEI